MADQTPTPQPTRHWIETAVNRWGIETVLVCESPETCTTTAHEDGQPHPGHCDVSEWASNEGVEELVTWPEGRRDVMGRLEVSVVYSGSYEESDPELVPVGGQPQPDAKLKESAVYLNSGAEIESQPRPDTPTDPAKLATVRSPRDPGKDTVSLVDDDPVDAWRDKLFDRIRALESETYDAARAEGVSVTEAQRAAYESALDDVIELLADYPLPAAGVRGDTPGNPDGPRVVRLRDIVLVPVHVLRVSDGWVEVSHDADGAGAFVVGADQMHRADTVQRLRDRVAELSAMQQRDFKEFEEQSRRANRLTGEVERLRADLTEALEVAERAARDTGQRHLLADVESEFAPGECDGGWYCPAVEHVEGCFSLNVEAPEHPVNRRSAPSSGLAGRAAPDTTPTERGYLVTNMGDHWTVSYGTRAKSTVFATCTTHHDANNVRDAMELLAEAHRITDGGGRRG